MSARVDLNAAERRQLGEFRQLRDGGQSRYRHPTALEWPKVRALLEERSRTANPALDPKLCAYTPGETRALLESPEVAQWHAAMRQWHPPKGTKLIVFVPCAKTKPWEGDTVKRSRLYTAYNQLRSEFPQVTFVTVSEPLGIVPQEHWGDFPQYDNPGLFHDDAQRSGMTTAQWRAFYGSKLLVPFDESAYGECITFLGDVISDVVRNCASLPMIGCTETGDGVPGTHSSMLKVAMEASGERVVLYPKRSGPHESPYGLVRAQIVAALGQREQSSLGLTQRGQRSL